MNNRVRAFILDITAALLLGLTLALAAPQVQAEMIQVDAIQVDDQERERVKSLLARPEVAAELEKMGVPPQEARARVDAMNGVEVRELAGRLDALPAGGQMSTQNLLLLIIIIILILILI
jgi:hypothetical protein